ncbi:helix-turn-helix domain-containing protein [Rhodoplanes elegans]|uniref:helix-turn-helix domain-containing protein n=1 Tax=Rhodoplanes elegans TaxID=29408 RepID=UPI00237B4C22|nr:helix-turn-helix domain-containing protein [Rhodoplanes elegans]
MSPRAKVVFGVLLNCHNSRTGRCDPRVEVLAELSGCKRRVVSDVIGELAAGGWLTVQRRPGSSIYTLNFDRVGPVEDVQDSAQLDGHEDVRETAQQDVQDSAQLAADEPAKMCGIPHDRCAESRISDVRDSACPIEKPGNETGKRNREESLSVIHDGELFPPPTASGPPGRPARTAKPSMAEVDRAFAEFWDAYPRRKAKGAAERAFAAALKAGADPAAVIAGARRYAAERAGQDPKFTKHPTTWLNAEAWLDEPDALDGAARRTGIASAVAGIASFLEDRR